MKTPKQSPKMSPKKSHPKKDNEQAGPQKLPPPTGSPKISPKNGSPKPSPKKLKAAKDPSGSAGASPKLPAKKILGNKINNEENIPGEVNHEAIAIAVPKTSPSRLRRSSTFDEIKEDVELVLTNGAGSEVNVGKAKENRLKAAPEEEPHIIELLDEIREEADENDSLPPGSYS